MLRLVVVSIYPEEQIFETETETETEFRLNRLEFERRYQFMPPQKKAELIDGVI